MKILLPLIILISIPLILGAILFFTAIRLLPQHFSKSGVSEKETEYPHLTSWEED